MLRSPEAVVEELLSTSTYQQLISQRDEWLNEVRKFEKNEIPEENWNFKPSPSVFYQWNLEALGLLCQGMAEKYRVEYEWKSLMEEE